MKQFVPCLRGIFAIRKESECNMMRHELEECMKKQKLPQKPVEVRSQAPWDASVIKQLIKELWTLRAAMLKCEESLAQTLAGVAPEYAASARNFAHYLALRRSDIRPLQERLAWIGVSSLGRSEINVLANLDKVLGILHRLVERHWESHTDEEPIGIQRGQALLDLHTERLLGVPPAERRVRIMVTLPSEAAADFGLVRQLVAAGMDVARINCAHDEAPQWIAMAGHVRRAAKMVGRPVKILMDLGGPKLSNGPIAPAPAVLKLRPLRDEFGRVIEPARLSLRASGMAEAVDDTMAQVIVDAGWLARLEVGAHIELCDARNAMRVLTVVDASESGVLAECEKTIYLVPETRLVLRRESRHSRRSKHGHETGIDGFPERPGVLHLQRGDLLRLTRGGVGKNIDRSSQGKVGKTSGKAGSKTGGRPVASAPCTLPEVFAQVRKGERIWFDDGHIGGVVRHASAQALEVEITDAGDNGERLAGDKGINLPDTELHLPALTEKDIADLAVVAKHADLVGLSFAQRAADVEALQKHLRQLGAASLGIILKIETRRGFENLPEQIFAAMANHAAGVMIARGDLAVECGYERLAEVQEEILWATEAAHMPVIWATQVLETLAKTGQPSRAEITDAAMGERAECVMLNKGPYILDAMRTLNDILHRMQAHQTKKRTLLRALRAWMPESAKGHKT